ncbi:unnamed protein product, partial [Didymodactylos carnosus]
YHPPHRNQVQRELKRLHGVHMSRLKQTLKNVTNVALTSDFWSDRRNNSYLCLTGHYMDTDVSMKSTVLHFQSYSQRHFAQNIAAEVNTRLRELGIDKKITSVTCDGAQNMQNAFDTIDQIDRLWCVAHRLHLTICNGLGLWKKFKKQHGESDKMDIADNDLLDIQTPFDESQSQNTSNDDMELSEASEDEEDIDDDEDEENLDLIFDSWDEQVLTAEDVNIEIEDDNNEEQIEITKRKVVETMQKCRSLIKIVRRSQIFTLFINDEKNRLNVPRRLIVDCITRWNSTYLALKALLEHKQVLINLFDNKCQLKLSTKQKEKLTASQLSSDEWTIIIHLIEILEPFQLATELLSGSQYPTIGICLFVLRNLKDFLKTESDNESYTMTRLKSCLAKSMNHYFNDKDEQHLLLIVSVF